MAKKRDTKKTEPKLDKLATLSTQQDVLERNAVIDPDGYDSSHKIAICYNPACPDYRKERLGAKPCACKKTTVGSLS